MSVALEQSPQQGTWLDLSLVLTVNELAAFLAHSNLGAVQGVGVDFGALLAAEAGAARVAAGTQALVARGLAHANGDGRVAFDSKVTALVGSAAAADTVAVLTRMAGAQPAATVHLLRTPALTLSCRQADRDTYVFTALPTEGMARRAAEEFLLGMCPVNRVEAAAAELPVVDFARVMADAREGGSAAAAEARLAQAGFPRGAAAEFLADLAARTSWTCAVVSNLRRRDPLRTRAVTVVNAATHCWLVQTVADGARVRIEAAADGACMAAVLGVLAAEFGWQAS